MPIRRLRRRSTDPVRRRAALNWAAWTVSITPDSPVQPRIFRALRMPRNLYASSERHKKNLLSSPLAAALQVGFAPRHYLPPAGSDGLGHVQVARDATESQAVPGVDQGQQPAPPSVRRSSRADPGSAPRAPAALRSGLREHLVEALPSLPLPGAHLVRVHLVAGRDRLHRVALPERVQRHPLLERRRETAPLLCHASASCRHWSTP